MKLELDREIKSMALFTWDQGKWIHVQGVAAPNLSTE